MAYFVNLPKHTDFSMTAVKLLKIFMKIKKYFFPWIFLLIFSFFRVQCVNLTTSLFCFLTCLVKSFGNSLRIGGGAEYLKSLSFVPGLLDKLFNTFLSRCI